MKGCGIKYGVLPEMRFIKMVKNGVYSGVQLMRFSSRRTI